MMRRLSLRQQITFLVGLLCLVLVSVAAFGASYIAFERTKQEIMADSEETASTLAAILDRGMAERYREIRNIASLRPLQGIWTREPDSIRQVLEQLQATYPDYSWIGFATPDGTVQASTRGVLEGASAAEQPWFQEGLKAPYVGDVHEAKLLDQLLHPSSSDEPSRFVDFSAPVHDENGKLIGVIGAHLNWDWARERLEILLNRRGIVRPEAIWILARDGSVLLGPEGTTKPLPDTLIARMKEYGSGCFELGDGHDKMLTGFAISQGYRDYPGLGWITISRQEDNVAFTAARSAVWTILGLCVVVALLGILFALFIAQGVSKPLQAIIAATDKIGRDPTVSLPPIGTGSREIVRLSAVLRSLVRRAGAAEKRVLEVSTLREQEVLTLTRLAETDALSGLLNRRGFDILGEEAFAQFKQFDRLLAVLIVDIDHFKRVNDTYGHAAGDEVIRAIGEALTRQLRSTDTVCRFGGEEFVVLLRDTSRESVQIIARQIRSAVERLRPVHHGRTLSVTVSVGGALASDADRDIQDVFERADIGLYEAKSTGRNRVVIASVTTPVAVALT
ncbi:sensor domain-containing diguanylate cyclase [Microvirga puerhi]|uniref:diguanylate cyclase n=1 Tax=Microvirga puerhi TaxID=2876078 RepID=A0ABS7VIC5_9HYPH|nr:sensor domain-containing diguanylate cyclase [Microvirga puerhi]MBZ6075242.1 sensor domain-containing diguanylate cyclase [Microvirga puerhi]